LNGDGGVVGSIRPPTSAKIRSLLLLVGLVLVALPVLGKDQQTRSIESIRFRGNETISSRRLRGVMRLHQPAWWNPFRKTPYLGADYLTADLYRILDLYQDEGFPLAVVRDAEVRISEREKEVHVTIEVNEGPRCVVWEVQLEGVDSPLLRRARERVLIHPRDFLRKIKLDRTREELEAFFVEAGYLGARVSIDSALQGRYATVTIRVVEGPLYTMRSVVVDTLRGRLEKTAPSVVKREVLLKEGEIFRTSRLLETQDRLFETGIFRQVRVFPVPDSLGEPVADLRVVVHEQPSGWYGFGAGYSSDDRLRFLAEWGNRNISGKARRLVAEGDLSFALDRSSRDRGLPIRTALGRLRYTEPWIFRTRTRSLSTLYHSYEVVTPATDNEEIYDRDITGLEEALSRSIGRYSTISVGIANKWVRTGDPTSAKRRYQTRNLSAVLQEDRRNDILDPTRGTLVRLLGEYAGGFLGGQNEFSRWTAEASWYRAVVGKLVLATRTRAGLIVPVGRGVGEAEDSLLVARIPSEERFRLGGGTTVRGYPDNSLGRVDPEQENRVVGGTALLLANAELRFPIVWLLKGALFFDAGNVWADPKEIKPDRFRDGLDPDSRSALNVAYSVGGGLRVLTAVGPFRIDYGRRLGGGQRRDGEKGAFHLSLGQAF